MTKKVLIADDENHVCIELDYILSKEPWLEIVSACSSGDEALDNICRYNPDIVFLDIDMPGLDGIKLGRYLSKMKNPPYMVFVTAYEKYAREAIQVGAKGYILKPFSDEEIKEQLDKAKEYLEEKEPQKLQASITEPYHLPRISGEIKGKIKLFNQEDIVMAYAKERLVYLRTDGMDVLCHFTLSELESKLSAVMFLRCHRNYIINLYKIKEVNSWFNGTLLLTVEDKTQIEIPVSRNKVKEIKERLNL